MHRVRKSHYPASAFDVLVQIYAMRHPPGVRIDFVINEQLPV
ncbi:hypothetical protein D1AOALGA4SA_6895 [Olavius algarvensis Delta 1 endosymbiont]|nr:hypothetical protein D1AOALGA4SA_6895 [Olavius algarvensis Delta 1 endosymbiont]